MSFSSDPSQLTNQLPLTVDLPQDPKTFNEYLTLWMKRAVNTVNTKTGGLFTLVEISNSEQFYTVNNPNVFRNTYRKTFDLVNLNGGPIGAGATVSFAHNIVGLKYATLIYASCVDSQVAPNTQYFTVVYPNVFLDSVNINFTNPSGANSITSCIAVAEYLKN